MKRYRLNTMTAQVWSKIDQLPRRERFGIVLLISALIGIAAYGLLLRPSLHYYQREHQRYAENRELLNWINAAAPGVVGQQGAGTAANIGVQGLLSRVNQIARESGIPIRRAEPKEDMLWVWFDQTEFNLLVVFMEKLESETGVKVLQLSLEAGQVPGSAIGSAILAL